MPTQSQFPPGQLLLCFSRVFQPDHETEQSLLKQFSDSEQNRLATMKSSARRLEYLSSRFLMRHTLNRIFGENQAWQFEEQSGYSPRITNLPTGMHVNLSHSKGVICFALTDMPIGIDIEACEQQRDFVALSRLFMNSAERSKLAELAEPASFFYRCWCIKEAWYKAQPPSDQANLYFTGIATDEIAASHKPWHLTEGRIGEHYLVAASQNKPSQIRFHYFPDEKSWNPSFTSIDC